MVRKHTIPALSSALKVLCALARGEGSATTKELSQKLGIPNSTCYRILQTFAAFDWLRPTPGGRFEFSLGLLPLLKPLSDYQRMFDHFGEPLRELVEQTRLTAKVSIKQGDHAVTVFRVESPRMVAPSPKIGSAFPLAFGSSGSCLLSGMEDGEIAQFLDESPAETWQAQAPGDVWRRVREVRAEKACFDTGSYHPKIHTVSAPVFRGKDDILAAISLLGWPEDFGGEARPRLKKAILKAARACEAAQKSPPARHPLH